MPIHTGCYRSGRGRECSGFSCYLQLLLPPIKCLPKLVSHCNSWTCIWRRKANNRIYPGKDVPVSIYKYLRSETSGGNIPACLLDAQDQGNHSNPNCTVFSRFSEPSQQVFNLDVNWCIPNLIAPSVGIWTNLLARTGKTVFLQHSPYWRWSLLGKTRTDSSAQLVINTVTCAIKNK